MKCPECSAKISTKHYDSDFEWYECPKCEGCFTADEIEEASSGTSIAARKKGASKAKAMGRKVQPASRKSGASAVGVAASKTGKAAPLAKGKKRQTEIAEDLEALAKKEKEWLKPVASEEPVVTKHRDNVPTRQIVNIMADELQILYDEMGAKLDDVNAQDKALTLWRQVHLDTGITGREQEVEYVMCAEHA